MKFIDWLLGKSKEHELTIEKIKEQGAADRQTIADAYIVSLGLPETDSYIRSQVPGNHQLDANYKPFNKLDVAGSIPASPTNCKEMRWNLMKLL